MHIPTTKDTFTPWYKEPWAWFIVGIIAVAVCWGVFQLSMAFRNADSVVIDDYYKNGKTINEDLTRDQNAQKMDSSLRALMSSGVRRDE